MSIPVYQRNLYLCIYKVHECILYFSKESILQGTHVPPDWFARTSKRKEQIIAYMRWYYAYIKYTVYFSKESILQGTHLPPDWFARTSKRREKIIVYMIWYYAYIMYTSVFFKGIYTSGNSRTARRVRPNIQKKITDYSVHEMILCIII